MVEGNFGGSGFGEEAVDLDFAGEGDNPFGVEGAELVGGFYAQGGFAGLIANAGKDFGFDGGMGDGILHADGVSGENGGLQGFGQGFALAGGDMDGEGEPSGEGIQAGGIGGEAFGAVPAAALFTQGGQEHLEVGRAQEMHAPRKRGRFGKPSGEVVERRERIGGKGIKLNIQAEAGSGT